MPFFIAEDIYLNLLRDRVIPELIQLFPNRQNRHPHYVKNFTDFLNVFWKSWIGRRDTIEWPATSPALTPLDFYVWGDLKSGVTFKTLQISSELENKIRVLLILHPSPLKMFNDNLLED